MKKLALIAALGTLGFTGPASAEDIKIGFVTTLTTPAAVIGKQMQNAVNLAEIMLGVPLPRVMVVGSLDTLPGPRVPLLRLG